MRPPVRQQIGILFKFSLAREGRQWRRTIPSGRPLVRPRRSAADRLIDGSLSSARPHFGPPPQPGRAARARDEKTRSRLCQATGRFESSFTQSKQPARWPIIISSTASTSRWRRWPHLRSGLKHDRGHELETTFWLWICVRKWNKMSSRKSHQLFSCAICFSFRGREQSPHAELCQLVAPRRAGRADLSRAEPSRAGFISRKSAERTPLEASP